MFKIKKLREFNKAGVFFFALTYISLSLIFRIYLLIFSSRPPLLWAPSVLLGILSDLCPAMIFSSLAVFFSQRLFFSRFLRRKSFLMFSFIVFFSLIFLFFTEYFFFEEFNSRFNSVAVDYLIYPTEVFVNIWESYNVLAIVFVCLFLAIPFALLSLKFFYNKFASYPVKGFPLFSFIAGLILLLILPFEGFSFTHDRIAREISKNGIVSFFYSAYSHNLDYDVFYTTIPNDEAIKLVREAVLSKGETFTDNPLYPIERTVSVNGKSARLNVMIFLMESFGSEFIGALGANPSYTPRFDSFSKKGLLFDNIYAIGNRTVRGLEGVLAGFPPLPTESLVKMKFSSNIKTLPQILKEKGYQNYFVYGGRGIFDNMKPFAMRYGFDYFIEQKDFKSPSFKTIWGVADEDIFNMSLEKAKEAYSSGKPFFFLTLSVSNHKPYTYPTGRIPEDPSKKKRQYAVKYTDWALGEFFSKAEKEPFYRNTIFIVIADHGARVYGSQEIPIKSYEIPLLIISPTLKPGRNHVLGSSADVPGTIMSLLNQSYKNPFFGKSLLNTSKNRWVPLNHNRSVGYYDGDSMIVLGLNRNNAYYKVTEKSKLIRIDPAKKEYDKEKKAVSIFQTAWGIYKNGL